MLALLNSGSQCTIIIKGLCDSLKLPGKVKKVNFGIIKDEEIMTAKVVNLNISSVDGNFETDVDNVYSLHENYDVPNTADPKWNYVKDISFPDVKPERVQILISADVPSVLISDEVRKGGKRLPYTSKTPFGWTLIGVCKGTAINSFRVNHVKVNEQENLDKVVRSFWETEAFGTKINSNSMLSVNDKMIF